MCVPSSPSLISGRNDETRVYSHELFSPGNIALFESDDYYGNFSITNVSGPLLGDGKRARNMV
jgi:hypothetical protein